MRLRFLKNWKDRKAGETAELAGKDAVEVLNEKAAKPEVAKPADRAEKRPKPPTEKR